MFLFFFFFSSFFLAGVKIFHDFLKSQYSEENLLFWLAVEKLKKETDQAAVKELAQSIYRDYLSSESPKEVCNCSFCYASAAHQASLFKSWSVF